MFGSGLLTSDRWKRLSWIFGPDALALFLGKDARKICVLLGFGEEWLNNKIPKGKKFKLAIFPSKAVDAQCATWEGVTDTKARWCKCGSSCGTKWASKAYFLAMAAP